MDILNDDRAIILMRELNTLSSSELEVLLDIIASFVFYPAKTDFQSELETYAQNQTYVRRRFTMIFIYLFLPIAPWISKLLKGSSVPLLYYLITVIKL